ncbi:uncharacterized protein A1O5_01757 [Cladophialophora psammophila CBS 110553]|uniref:Cupin 2 conserved barrel domain-containing protein n=1 Tax=Cladophialophora psammophila CBS 110553 TaxID=1182543 RepID=W9XDM2_9EURO|nr:uncharacterized protein A1O5_01757 [Cladophialophora psammophila CBS 110553]EXJ75061.1 hypothetical protein A1O5_01757 [Cladophialophora psammophila CBS 110553]
MSEPQTAPSGLRPSKRYIATHDPVTGRSTYASAPDYVYAEFPGFGCVTRSYATSSLPARLQDDEDIKAFESNDTVSSHTRARDFAMPASANKNGISTTQGVNLNVLDVIPGAVGHWHRTVSMDISICVMGELDHELESGGKVRLYPGDHIIQRATLHRWSNSSKEQPARLIAAILPCEDFHVGGKPVQEAHFAFGEGKPQ